MHDFDILVLFVLAQTSVTIVVWFMWIKKHGLGLGMHISGLAACSSFSKFYGQCSWKEHYLDSMIWTSFDIIICTRNF